MSNLKSFPNAHMPSEGEIRARKNLVIQLARFIVLNTKMIVMVTKGHH